MEVRSEDSDVEQDISSEESEDELGMSEEYFFGKDKESKWRENPIRRQIRKQPQNMVGQLLLVWPNAKNAETELETYNCFIANDILDLILLYTNKYISSVSNLF